MVTAYPEETSRLLVVLRTEPGRPRGERGDG
jgi:hypothetical protein